ncbi:hypothetical protein [Sediminibacillus albus]|uniref:Uncharacterized protein n=1 Tax=Sediminibacillus albus TaxID=407036 RepID=A0A1G9AR94_9BACI|nr:hypothetical protein [Sediminibacillus albus]SDK29364.1 hypothetical protein SAMN05216243_2655 [Sediminibacillus albus]
MKNILPTILPTFLIIFGLTSYLTTKASAGALLVAGLGVITLLIEVKYIKQKRPRYRTAASILAAGIIFILFLLIEQYVYGEFINYFFAAVLAVAVGLIANVIMRDREGN